MKNHNLKLKIDKDNFLPTITTLSAKFNVGGNNWRDKIKEIDELGLKKVAIFPTCLNKKQRQEMYSLLEKTQIKEVPFAHLRSDMPPEELDYLVERFKTQVFNIHTERQWPLQFDLSKYQKKIFMEYSFRELQEAEVSSFRGVCLDFSHMENDRLLHKEEYQRNLVLLNKYQIGCNHISAISKAPLVEREDGSGYSHKFPHHDKHTFNNLSEFGYLKNYPKEFFSNFCAIEVENSLADQLKVIDYIIKTLNS